MAFLPITKKDMKERGWDELDFVFISGEAYVDHPSFGHAIITRLLEKRGYRVGVIAEPRNNEDYKKLGIPKIAFLISSGVIDSMVNNYSVAKHKRKVDEYSPGGKTGLRMDRAVNVYVDKVKELMPNVPVIIGGIEASLRRFAHYDYWDDKVRKSILIDTNADLLIYGMGEKPFLDICTLLEKGVPINKIKNVRGTAYIADSINDEVKELASFEEVIKSKEKYAKSFMDEYKEQNKVLAQRHGNKYVIQNPAQNPMTEKEMDMIYSLPYERAYHPSYEKFGGVPSIREVEFSITSARGCFGACNFCAITFHQGRAIQSRSHKSIINEAKNFVYAENFKGYIHDVGGPTANFRQSSCDSMCGKRECLFPTKCKNLKVDHSDYLKLLKELREIPGIKKVFIRSGIRYDYLMYDKNDEFFNELCKHHVSGQLKVAPEHVVDYVLDKMGKPKNEVYEEFRNKFIEINKKINKEQYIVPYLISSHPGSDLKAAIKLAEYLRDIRHMPEQVQDFYPTPGTISTCMFYTGIDPRTMKKIYVPKTAEEKSMQRALLQYRKKENYYLVLKALKLAHREDLIGFDKKCLIKPKRNN